MFSFLLASVRLFFVIVITLIYLTLILLSHLLQFSLKVRHFLLGQWARLFGWILGFNIEKNKKEIPQGVLVLPNHRSWIDVPLILGIIPAVIISKKEIRSWPFIGWGFKAIDAILVDRSKMGSLITTFKEIKRKIKENKTVILFPEGTICEGPETGRFKKGAFKVAAEDGIKIIPIAFEFKDRRDVWAGDEVLLRHYFNTMGKWKTYIKVEIGDPIESNEEIWLSETTKNWMDEKILAMRREWDA